MRLLSQNVREMRERRLLSQNVRESQCGIISTCTVSLTTRCNPLEKLQYASKLRIGSTRVPGTGHPIRFGEFKTRLGDC
jgi:hypothetical protein